MLIKDSEANTHKDGITHNMTLNTCNRNTLNNLILGYTNDCNWQERGSLSCSCTQGQTQESNEEP